MNRVTSDGTEMQMSASPASASPEAPVRPMVAIPWALQCSTARSTLADAPEVEMPTTRGAAAVAEEHDFPAIPDAAGQRLRRGKHARLASIEQLLLGLDTGENMPAEP